MFHQACNDLGCAVIPGGIGNTDLQIETIKNLKPSFYIGTPSFLKILLEKAKENKIDISCFQKGLVGAEPLPPILRNTFWMKELMLSKCMELQRWDA